jgi:hypothetical protein
MANTAATARNTTNSVAWTLVTDGAGTVSTVLNQATVAGIIGISVIVDVLIGGGLIRPNGAIKTLLTKAYASSALVQAAFEGIGATFVSTLVYCDWSARLVAGTAPVTMPLMVSSASGGFGIMTITNENTASTYLVTCTLHGIDG